ncbi:MAG TPA: hypothetical protein VFX76_15280 [Roseiflexaceae bacterium]|nr:hypothetical protein [Roseiflexaceae bacterium]
MRYYDYERIPNSVADQAFADFNQNRDNKSILDLLSDLIRHCDRWCEEHRLFSDDDNRVAVIQKLQAYIHERYADELSDLMRLNIAKYRERQEIIARFEEWKN